MSLTQVGTFEWFQAKAKETAVYPGQGSAAGLAYAVLGLTGEAGEVANQAKKVLRDDGGLLTDERQAKLLDELSDVLWYLATTASEAGLSLDAVAKHNVAKLAARKTKDQLRGDARG